MSDFNSIRNEYIRQIKAQLKEIVKSVTQLDLTIAEAVSVSEDFRDVSEIWKSFYDPTLLDKLEEEEEERKDEAKGNKKERVKEKELELEVKENEADETAVKSEEEENESEQHTKRQKTLNLQEDNLDAEKDTLSSFQFDGKMTDDSI